MYKLRYTLVVLSENQDPEGWDLATVIEQCMTGDLVLQRTDVVTVSLTGKEMADALYEAGSEPGFFQLDDDGERIE